jgi:hypothetical protein
MALNVLILHSLVLPSGCHINVLLITGPLGGGGPRGSKWVQVDASTARLYP